MSEKQPKTIFSISFPSMMFILTIVFVIAKFAGWIAWSWWWVLSPVWITAGVFVIVFIAIIISYFIVKRIDERKAAQRLFDRMNKR